MVICASLKSVLDQTEGSRNFYVCEGVSVCVRVCAGTNMSIGWGCRSGCRGGRCLLWKEAVISETAPESNSAAPSGLASRGQGEASLFTCLCLERRGCWGLGLMSSVLPHLLGGSCDMILI